MTLRKPIVSVVLRFEDGSVVTFEGFERGQYTQMDTWREGEIKGKAIEKWVSHNVQWTSDRVKIDE